MKKFIKILSFILVIFTLVGCGNSKSGDGKNIKIGSKDFTENLIVSEIYALALEDAGFDVDRMENIASSVIHTSIESGEIDLYPEYTGTGLLTILKLPMETDSQKVYDKVKDEYLKKFNLVWLDYAPASDSQGLVISKKVADKYKINTISELQKNADKIRFASQGEFDKRDDGIVGLEKVYGKFNWKSSVVYDNSLKYQVLKSDEADVAPAYTTEGQLVDTDSYKVLEDDKNFWPPYNIAPVVRKEVVDKNPNISNVLNKVNEKLTTEVLIKLNAQVDVDKKDYEEVARDFYETIK